MLQAVLDSAPPTVEIWNHLVDYYIFFGVAAGVVVTVYMVYNIMKNRAKEGRAVPKFHEESDFGGWKTVALTLLVTGSVLSFVEYQTFASVNLVTIPNDPNAVHINVIAQQWSWTFQYPNGAKVVGNLTVPAGQVIILNVTSLDVTHSFTVPDLSVAKDAQPGRFNALWFNATNTGVYTIRCKQICGTGHAFMLAKLTVVDPAAYQKWYSALGGK